MPNVQLTPKPELVTRHPQILLYLEKQGPFMKSAPAAWREFWQIAGGKIDRAMMTGMVGLSRIDETKTGDEIYTYQAGITLKEKPAEVPGGLAVREIPTGRYARFVLTGSYSQLPEAYPLAFTLLAQTPVKLRPDFCIEGYLNSPDTTPEDQLQTEILIPVVQN